MFWMICNTIYKLETAHRSVACYSTSKMATSQNPTGQPTDLKEEGEFSKLVSSLPREKWWISPYLYKYRDFWFASKQLKGVLACEQNFLQAQDNDVLLATLPKSGTTWLKAVLFALANRRRYPITSPDHPLLSNSSHGLVPFMEFMVDSHSSVPRAFSGLCSTHLPVPFLPASVLDSRTKIIYLCRNPKDTLVSQWHFANKTRLPRMEDPVSIDDLFEKFCQGVSLCGPFWDHVLGYWNESVEKPDKVFFLRYESMKEDPAFYLKLLADFICCPFTAEEEASGVVDEIIDLCSFENMSKLEINKSGKMVFGKNEAFFRRGEVGDWKNYLTTEMANRLDHISEEKFQGSGLKF